MDKIITLITVIFFFTGCSQHIQPENSKDIEKINDPDLRAKEMIAVEKIREQKQDLDAKL